MPFDTLSEGERADALEVTEVAKDEARVCAVLLLLRLLCAE